ncbi:MAG: hypothetical protein ACFB2Z_10855 [Maricaulaceae bacterium]
MSVFQSLTQIMGARRPADPNIPNQQACDADTAARAAIGLAAVDLTPARPDHGLTVRDWNRAHFALRMF